MSQDQTTPADGKEALDALRDLYMRKDGNMRSCKYFPSELCHARRCDRGGCARANDILNSQVEKLPA